MGVLTLDLVKTHIEAAVMPGDTKFDTSSPLQQRPNDEKFSCLNFLSSLQDLVHVHTGLYKCNIYFSQCNG